MMLIYALLTFVVLMVGARTLALLFVDTTELEILKNTELFLHVSAYFFPFLGLLCILRYTIQGAGYTNLAMLSGVSEMIPWSAYMPYRYTVILQFVSAIRQPGWQPISF